MSQAHLVPMGFGGLLALFGVAYLREAYTSRATAERVESANERSVSELLPGEDEAVILTGTLETAADTHEAPVAETTAPVVQTEPATLETAEDGDDDHDEVVDVHTTSGSYDYYGRHVLAAPFTLADGTGEVRVEPPSPSALDGVVEPDAHVDFELRSDLSEPTRRFLDEHDGLDVVPQTVRLRQGVIQAGDTVTVRGRAVRRDGRTVVAANEVGMVLSDRSPSATAAEFAESGLAGLGMGLVLIVLGVGVASLPFVF